METLSDNWRAAAAIVATGATLLFLMRQLSRRRARKKREAKRRALADAQCAHPEFPAVDPGNGNGAPLLTGPACSPSYHIIIKNIKDRVTFFCSLFI